MSSVVNRLLSRPRVRALCASASRPLAWEPARFKGATITIHDAVDDTFEPALVLALEELRAAGRRGVWMRVPIAHAAAAAVAGRHGFAWHHAEGTEATLLRWLPSDDACPVPAFATHIVGCGGLVLNRRSEVLCVREAQTHRPTSWKLPGGLMDLGEEVSDATVREVFEETGVRTAYQSLLSMRVQHGAAFGRDDFYFVSALTPLGDDEEIRLDGREIAECAWLPIGEYLADTERVAEARGIGDTMNSWLIRNVAARIDSGAPPSEWGWQPFELSAGAAQSAAQVTGWGSRPTYHIFAPPGFAAGRPDPDRADDTRND